MGLTEDKFVEYMERIPILMTELDRVLSVLARIEQQNDILSLQLDLFEIDEEKLAEHQEIKRRIQEKRDAIATLQSEANELEKQLED